jgi:hypothetical protein
MSFRGWNIPAFMTQSRRQFLTTIGVAGILGRRVVNGQTAGSPLPSVDLGQTVELLTIRNVSVIDMTGHPAIDGAAVVLDGNRIVSVGAPSPSRDSAVLDATGKFLIPGLWDMHTHAVRTPLLFIANGVTGIRNMGASLETLEARDEIARNRRLGPRIVAGLYLDGPAQGQRSQEWQVSTADTGRAAVRRAIREGYEFIKVYNRLPRDAYFAIMDEARKQGLPAVGHVPFALTPAECSNAGQRSFEHMFGIGNIAVDRYDEWRQSAAANPSGTPGFAEFQPGVDSFQVSRLTGLAGIMRKNKTWLCPTLIASALIAYGPKSSDDPRLKFVRSQLKEFWANPQFPSTPRNRREHPQYMEAVRLLHKSGVGILAGTDAPSVPFSYPGFSLHEELQLLVKAGLTPLDALRSATSGPAEFFGLREHLGTVEAGKRAELVLLDANPLADIRNTQRINAVITGGRIYPRSALDKMLEFAEADARG